MSDNVKKVGYAVELPNKEKAMDVYKKLGFEPDEDGFCWHDDDKIGEWLPHLDFTGKLGLIYLIDYEYGAYDLFYVESEDSPVPSVPDCISELEGKQKRFAILYYNGVDFPPLFKEDKD